MYILIKKSLCPDLKAQISKLIDEECLETWTFVNDDGRRRLMHTVKNNQYDDVVLRFINTFVDGVSFIKILPTVITGTKDIAQAEAHIPYVLGRFAELLNVYFAEIGQYQTILE